MTIIARFEINGVPVMIGDTLLTDEVLSWDLLAIPSVRSSADVYGDYSNKLAGLVQKISIFEGKAVLCFAGPYKHAHKAAGTLNRHLSLGASIEEAWNLTISSLTFVERQGLALIFEGMEMRDERYASRFALALNTKRLGKFKVFENLEIAGTGSDVALEILKTHDFLPTNLPNGKYELAVQKALSFTAQLLDLDLRSRKSFANDFGGFYEIAFWYGSRYIKLDGVQYVYWTMVHIGDEVKFRLDRIYMQYYENLNLCIDEVLVSELLPESVSAIGCIKLPISKILHHRIATLETGFEAGAFRICENTNFVHRSTVHCFRVDPNDVLGPVTRVTANIQSPDDYPDIRLEENAVQIRNGLLREFRRDILQTFEYGKAEAERAIAEAQNRTWASKILAFLGSK